MEPTARARNRGSTQVRSAPADRYRTEDLMPWRCAIQWAETSTTVFDPSSVGAATPSLNFSFRASACA
jgi:hypothetical protein